MKRLTQRHDHGIKMAAGYDFGIDPDDYDLVQEILERLAAYEDTGLSPDEAKDMAENAETRLLTWFESRYGFPVGTVMDLLEAKQQGRLVVLPCKAGDTVYVINDWEVEKTVVSSMTIRNAGHSLNIFLTAEVEDHGIKFKDGYGSMYKTFELGKTVFLTREEAERALEGGSGNA